MKILIAIPLALAVIAAGGMGSVFQTGAWYEALNKPGWTPPNWLFPIAWTFLYISIAVAGYRVAVRNSPLVPTAMAFWALQITLNAIWTPIVFGANDLFLGVVVIVAMWCAIIATTVLNFRIDRIAGWLFVPYIAWVGYASALNISLWLLN